MRHQARGRINAVNGSIGDKIDLIGSTVGSLNIRVEKAREKIDNLVILVRCCVHEGRNPVSLHWAPRRNAAVVVFLSGISLRDTIGAGPGGMHSKY